MSQFHQENRPVKNLVRQVLAGPLEGAPQDALHPLTHLLGNQLLHISPGNISPRANTTTPPEWQKMKGHLQPRIRSRTPTAGRPGPSRSPSRPEKRPAGQKTNEAACLTMDTSTNL